MEGRVVMPLTVVFAVLFLAAGPARPAGVEAMTTRGGRGSRKNPEGHLDTAYSEPGYAWLVQATGLRGRADFPGAGLRPARPESQFSRVGT